MLVGFAIAAIVFTLWISSKHEDSKKEIERINKFISDLKKKYDYESWEFINSHPNCPGPAARSMRDNYNFILKKRQTENPLVAVVEDRKLAGLLTGYAGGDNLCKMTEYEIRSLINYCKSDLILIIYAAQYIESAAFRKGVQEDEIACELIIDVIYSNLILNTGGSLFINDHNERIRIAKGFIKGWYLKHFV